MGCSDNHSHLKVSTEKNKNQQLKTVPIITDLGKYKQKCLFCLIYNKWQSVIGWAFLPTNNAKGVAFYCSGCLKGFYSGLPRFCFAKSRNDTRFKFRLPERVLFATVGWHAHPITKPAVLRCIKNSPYGLMRYLPKPNTVSLPMCNHCPK